MFNYFVFIILFLLFVSFLVVYYLYNGWGNKSLWAGGGGDVWVSSFECGFIGHGYSENLFSYTFLNLLVIFIIFDLEVSLLLNIPFQGFWFDNYLFYLLFLLIVGFGYLFELEKGYISWSF